MKSNVIKKTIFTSLLSVALALIAAPLPAKDPATASELAHQLNQAFIEVAEKVSPAVVIIRVAHDPSSLELDDDGNPSLDTLPPQFRRWLEEYREKQRKEPEERPNPHREPMFDGQGSGVVIREEGYILTNRHVVERAKAIKVRLKDGTEYDAEVRGLDLQSDVAVLKIDPKGKKLTTARLGNSDQTRVGEFAIAIGAPFDLDYSVTYGHVSAKGRSRIINDPTLDQDYLQTDANINPGNSGGPLVNIDGEVIGINTLIRGMSTGIGFAIPANLAREIAERLILDGKFVRAYLGVKIRSLRDNQEFRDVVPGVEDGVVVFEIPKGSPAAKSELRAGDVITAIDGKAVVSSQQLKNEIRGKAVGSAVTLDVYRYGKNIQVKVKPEPWPEKTTPVVNKQLPVPEEKTTNLGLTIHSLTRELVKEFNVEATDGVIVIEVAGGSEAERKGIRPGDVITEVNHKRVSSPKQFREVLKAIDPKKGVLLNYNSGGASKVEILKDSGD